MDQSTVLKFIDSIFGEAACLLPEMIICLGAFSLLVIELVKPSTAANLKIAVALATMVISGVLVFMFAIDASYFDGNLYQNGLIRWVKILLLATGFVCLHFPKRRFNNRAEHPFLILMILLGSMLLIQSQHLLLFYLAIEMISISSYAVITFNFNKKGFEGGLKYLLFGAMSSGLMLYGISLIYGLTGSLSLDEILAHVPRQEVGYWGILAGSMILVGFFFKLSLVPFHVWTPDAYEAAPVSVVAFISIVPKVAVFYFLINYAGLFLDDVMWQGLLAVIAVISMFFGNLSAIRQDNAQRMMAYSTIAHAGTMLIAIVASNELGLQSLIFYLVVYAAMNLVGFYLIDIFQQNDIQTISGLSSVKGGALLYLSVVVVMIALTGLPPTGGFTAKLFVFTALWDAYNSAGEVFMLWLFILGLLNAAISLFYYLKIPYYLIVKKDQVSESLNLTGQNKVFLLIGISFVLISFFKADILMNLIESLL